MIHSAISRTLRLIMILVPILALCSCEKQYDVEEYMREIEGNYINNHLDYPAEVVKEKDGWVFRFHFPITLSNGVSKSYVFTQKVTWNPIVGEYAFQTLSKKECDLLNKRPEWVITKCNGKRITLIFKNRNDSYSGSYYSWTKVE